LFWLETLGAYSEMLKHFGMPTNSLSKQTTEGVCDQKDSNRVR